MTPSPGSDADWLIDAVTIVGFLLLAAGLAGYDWRLAAVVCGLLMLTSAVVGAWRQARRPADRLPEAALSSGQAVKRLD